MNKHLKSLYCLGAMLVVVGGGTAWALPPVEAVSPCPGNGGPEESGQTSVTEHRFAAGGKNFSYTAKAGTMVIRDKAGHPTAEIGYTSYARPSVKGGAVRPVIFAFNGGPGSSSVWLHVGMLGPKRVEANDAGPTPLSRLKVVDNPSTMLDKADLVLIDPVGTGFGRAICGKKDNDFWSVDADAESIGRFITQYLGQNDLWAAPKYILGESYGTIRAAVVLNWLRSQRVSFNGVIMLGIATDIEIIHTQLPGNDRPYPVFVPGFAAAAWYHKLVPASSGPLEPFLEEARRFALGPYAAALLRGNALPDAEFDAIAREMARFTGLSVEYVKASNLRVSEFAYGQEAMRARGKTISRLDSRYVGDTQDTTQKLVDYDPILSFLGTAYTTAFNDYYRRDLKVGIDRSYNILNDDAGWKFDMTHQPIGAPPDYAQPIVNANVDLATVMTQDPNLRMLVLAGYFDLGSTFTAAEYMVAHIQMPQSAQSRISMKYYMSGHMIYAHEPSLRQMKKDIDQFMAAGQ
ncbi:peptidase S10, serine carboxypeptidase [Rhizorhabdus wittichii RW1]|uniref:Peptidase S10, serine carboxypeptidase n=1 Tax=Rhizorhabdus wittichii (strain DSM 6014 / CCUG 31198 / JCM 15750 / NBRC 105917 / EY 4224 / RW1) TaxID=392499 RepID=A0A9J9H9H7_RHIWR|nr:peptidase S10, serine carboxypeptidase [Rhizorhabdus wittichii RW1]